MNIDQSLAKNSGGSGSQNLKLTFKELLNVSSDWKEVNKKTSNTATAIPTDFQAQ